METKVNYTVVGFFVIVAASIFFVGALWLSVGVSPKQYNHYLVYVSESVSGLSVKAPVKYNGVEVGYVSEIRLRREDPQVVRLLLDIEAGTPISVDTEAELVSQTLTGIAYVELSGGDPTSLPLLKKKGQQYPVIKSVHSLMSRIDAAVNRVTSDFDEITHNVSLILSKDNVAALHTILQNLQDVSIHLEKNAEKFDAIMEDAHVTLINTADASKNLPEILHKIGKAASEFSNVGASAQVTFNNTSTAAKTFNDELLPQMTEILTEVQGMTSNLKSLSAQLDSNPSVLIRGRNPRPPGPGE